MSAFSFSSDVSAETSFVEKTRDLNVLSQLKSKYVDDEIRKLEVDRLQQHSFIAISQYLKEASEINYQTFLTLRDIAPRNAKQYFSAKVFLHLQPDKGGFISSEGLIRYLHRSMTTENLIFKLLAYTSGNADIGYITNDQLHLFIQKEYIPLIDPHRRMDESFYEFYTSTAVAKFLFYLDPRNTHQISIRALAHSFVMQELLTLAQLQAYQDEFFDSEQLSKIEGNWFHYENVLNVYQSFLHLDADQSGLLSLHEIQQFRGFSVNPIEFSMAAVRRIAEELIVFAPFELDYRGFVKLILAIDDLNQPLDDVSKFSEEYGSGRLNKMGIKFIWKVVDFDRSGVLSPAKIKHFLSEIIPEMTRIGQYQAGESPVYRTVVGEIYDMLSYTGPIDMFDSSSGPTLDDLLASKQAETVLMMLLDFNAFYRYENRENFMHQGNDDAEEGQQNSTSNPSSIQQAPITPSPASSSDDGTKKVKSKFDYRSVEYDDEDDHYEDDYEF